MSSGFAIPDQIASIREFNRFYTAKLGLLRKHHLDVNFSLTEARILYEIGANPQITATRLRETLSLDRGYISRLLASLTRRKLIRHTASLSDAREKLLTLTTAGQRSATQLNESSNRHIATILRGINVQLRNDLIASLNRAHQILASPQQPQISIGRLTKPEPTAIEILEEYYEAVQVVKRDKPGDLHTLLKESNSAMWLARLNDDIVGCVVLRNLPSMPRAGECKRLYVRPSARGHHIATLLLDALEEHARILKLDWIYLDTHDGLKAAIALYQNRGYELCDRYNDNPQATLFMRKRL
ncbi:bifunctional helix-turn-helix transcriptional regulator/GNAT family N-acetyltransferase [Occallatibacter savannae]|uniref:bifunctional helix-turn-helix transcriptional regulator/GNAT family N-acetyltransferase n=1 Tax=Occallatibacter savannae TaxID=1002691 RepID=UPI0013A56EC4|nr:helix-turn-helix domain-containing GNAT family N-acetyltransferase [Occallatibacter savannae]